MKQQNKINEIKKFIRRQVLAGILSENIDIVNKILDKISAQGIDSLSSEEREYLERYSRGEENLPIPTSGITTVYVGEPYGELYKIENFPSIPNAQDVYFECEDTKDATTCKGYSEMIEMLRNKKFKFILDKIHSNESSLQDKPLYFHGIDFDGDFSFPIDVAYAQVAGDGRLYIVDSLDQFDGSYQTESGWGVKNWIKL